MSESTDLAEQLAAVTARAEQAEHLAERLQARLNATEWDAQAKLIHAQRQQLDSLRVRAGQAEAALVTSRAGAKERADLLEHARDLLEPWGGHGDAWPDIAPAIERLVTEHREAELRTAAGVPLICCDERHAAKVSALETRIAALDPCIDRVVGVAYRMAEHWADADALDEPADTPATRIARALGSQVDRMTMALTPGQLYFLGGGEWRSVPGVTSVSVDPIIPSYTLTHGQVTIGTGPEAYTVTLDAHVPEQPWQPDGPFLPPHLVLAEAGERVALTLAEPVAWPFPDVRAQVAEILASAPRRADHGPRPDPEPERPAGYCPTCEGQPRTTS